MSETMKELAEIAEAKQALRDCVDLTDALRVSGLNGCTNASVIALSNLAIAKSILALAATIDQRSNKPEKSLDASHNSIDDVIDGK